MQTDDFLIPVQCGWNAWQTAEVRVGDLEDLHWLHPPRAPRPLLHAYVSCDKVVNGVLPHNCRAADRPHRLLVCVIKRHTAPNVYSALATRAHAA
jgi:hypothetical protein